MIIVLMGVSGVGKTTIGKLLAAALKIPFYDGDDFHSENNIAKMSRGEPLTDNDRALWLASLRNLIQQLLAKHESAIIACSALKASYRQQLQVDPDQVMFVYLKGSYELIQQRLNRRQGHFMNPQLLASQFTLLEEPEDVLVVDVAQPLELVVGEIMGAIKES
ncbi:MAG: gluconokinase [Leptolyngbyaceae cyanobacterium SM2_5_2]|nr:gluconokinase [Leptolyngbyaceae cyanobacterium SM2_5_2]